MKSGVLWSMTLIRRSTTIFSCSVMRCRTKRSICARITSREVSNTGRTILIWSWKRREKCIHKQVLILISFLRTLFFYVFLLENIRSYTCASYHGVKVDGGPVQVIRAGLTNISGLFSNCNVQDIMEEMTLSKENAYTICDAATRKSGKLVKQIVIFDMASVGWIIPGSELISSQNKASEIAKDLYPQLLEKVIIMNAPWFMSQLWKVCLFSYFLLCFFANKFCIFRLRKWCWANRWPEKLECAPVQSFQTEWQVRKKKFFFSFVRWIVIKQIQTKLVLGLVLSLTLPHNYQVLLEDLVARWVYLWNDCRFVCYFWCFCLVCSGMCGRHDQWQHHNEGGRSCAVKRRSRSTRTTTAWKVFRMARRVVVIKYWIVWV